MEPLYKVGDIVKIKHLSIEDDRKYRFGLNDDMVKLSGKSVEIERVTQAFASDDGKIPDDGYLYRIKCSSWSWASSMFEESSKKSTKSKSKKSKTKISFHKKREIKFNFNL